MNKLNVCSWNLLSPYYCNKYTYNKIKEKYLKLDYRIKLIKNNLLYLINKKKN